MGRSRTVHPNLPPRVYAVPTTTGFRYYYGKNKVPLGSDLELAKQYAAKLEGAAPPTQHGALLSHRQVANSAVEWKWRDDLCGVYFLILAGQIVYVGQSTNILRRVGAHARTGRIKFDSVSWTECENRHLHRLERAYINLFDPPENRKPFTPTVLETSLAPRRRGRKPKTTVERIEA